MKRITIPYSILLLFSIIVYGLWRIDSPYPSVLNWDIFEHQTVINQIHGGTWAILPSSLTDTFRFDGYTTLFHSFIAGIQWVLRIDPLGWWWLAEGVHLLLTVLMGYVLTLVITKDRWASVLAGIIGATIFESQVAYSSLFLLPQTTSALFGVLGFTMLFSHMKLTLKHILVPMAFLLAVLMHFIIGGYLLGILGVLWFAWSLTKHQIQKLTTALVLLIPTISYMIKTSLPIQNVNYGEAAAFTHSATDTFGFLLHWYGGTFILIPVAIIFSLLSPKPTIRLLGLLSAISLTTLFAPLPYALKFMVVGRYFIITTIALTLSFVIRTFAHIYTKIIACGLITLTFLLIFIQNIQLWKAPLREQGTTSEINAEERAAGKFLNASPYANTDTALLVSDPATQYILEATSAVNSQGGAYASAETRERAARIIYAASITELTALVSDIHDPLQASTPKTIIFVASGRYFRWLDEPDSQLDIASNIWRPERLTLKDYEKIYAFQERFHLVSLYHNPSLMIFAIPLEGTL